jgi:NAD(P)-dependent dehydrogenase (short-subunit alcohol dehydrogenase family)
MTPRFPGASARETEETGMGFGESDISDQTGRVAVVTGANSGIGFETARALAEKGARVVLGCRDPGRGREAEQRLRGAVPKADARFVPLDLGTLASVERFAAELAGEEEKIDLLVNNAGVMMPPYGRTADGFELQLGTNHLGHFALTARLLPLVRNAGPGARIVSVSSLAHYFGRIDFADPHSERSYDAMRAYGQSKLANLLFTRELSRRLEARGERIVAAGAHPGSTRTNLQAHSRLMRAAVALYSQEPAGGALPTLYAATAPGVRGGDYFGPTRMFEMTGPPGPARSTPASKNMETAKRLWDFSEELTGVAFGI